MPFINLIHEKRQLVRQKEQTVRLLILSTLGIGAILFLASGYFVFTTARYQLMASGLEAKKKSLAPLLRQLQVNENDSQTLEPKLTSLTNATKATEQWYRIFEHLSVSTPQGLWLTGVRCSQTVSDEAGQQVSFNGFSLDHDAIAEFILRLETCTDLEGVTLKYSQEKVEEKQKVLEFEIDAVLAGSKVAKKVKEKESA